jgi:large subunit ribosomal protein L10
MKNKQFKIAKVEDIAQKLSSAKSAALLHYQGLTAPDLAALRAKIKATGGTLEVIKNSLLSRALQKLGLSLPRALTGPTAITYCDTDETAPLKEIEIVNRAKSLTSFKYGIYQLQLLTPDELDRFLALPSKSALLSQLLTSLQNPLFRLDYALGYHQTRLVLALKTILAKSH